MLERDVPVYLASNFKAFLRSDIPPERYEVISMQVEPVATKEHYQVVDWIETFGCKVRRFDWPGYYESHATALKYPLQTDWLLFLEDDTEFSPTIYSEAQRFIADNPEMRMATLFNSRPEYHDSPWIHPRHFVGTLAMLYHRSVLERFPDTWNEFQHPLKQAMSHPHADVVVMLTCGEELLYIHHGAMVENIGMVSSWGNLTAEDQPKSFKPQLKIAA